MDAAVAAAEAEGAPFAERVRRERLSIDHMLLLNYAILRDLATKNGPAWNRPQDPAKAVEMWIEAVKAQGVKAIHETTSATAINQAFDALRKTVGAMNDK